MGSETGSVEDQTLWQATWRNMQSSRRAAAHWERQTNWHRGCRRITQLAAMGWDWSTPCLEFATRAEGRWGWKKVWRRRMCPGMVSGIRHARRAPRPRMVVPARRGRCPSPGEPIALPGFAPQASCRCCCRLLQLHETGGRELKEDHWSEKEWAAPAQRPKAMLLVEVSGRFFALLLERLLCEGVDHVCSGLAKTKTCPRSQAMDPEAQLVDFVSDPSPRARTSLWARQTQAAWPRGSSGSQGSVAVFNGDNLPPEGAVSLLHQTPQGGVAPRRARWVCLRSRARPSRFLKVRPNR